MYSTIYYLKVGVEIVIKFRRPLNNNIFSVLKIKKLKIKINILSILCRKNIGHRDKNRFFSRYIDQKPSMLIIDISDKNIDVFCPPLLYRPDTARRGPLL